MLTRLYVDNFRAFGNFELKCTSDILLLAGRNGAGKSSVFDVLRKIRDFAGQGWEAANVFPIGSCTRWDDRKSQRFEVTTQSDEHTFQYALTLSHVGGGVQVADERLECDASTVFTFDGATVSLFRGNKTQQSTYPATPATTGVKTVPDQAVPLLGQFREQLMKMVCVHINPFVGDKVGWVARAKRREGSHLSQQTRNFPAWYSDRVLEDPVGRRQLEAVLASAIDGFEALILPRDADERLLKARIGGHNYLFGELSDGQRCLIILYALLSFAPGGSLLCIDEPAAFIALREIQPWLHSVRDWCRDRRGQILLATHSPPLIDLLGHRHGVLLHHGPNQPVQQKPLCELADSQPDLPLSEVLALGWDATVPAEDAT